MQQDLKKTLTFQDTYAFKGIAILLMLVHHLFYKQEGLYNDFYFLTTSDGAEHFFVQEIGVFSKLCVSIFVFLSGYGLMVQAEIKGGISSLKSYYIHRFKKLYLNYWFFWLTFVPISLFLFGYSFIDAYKTNIAFNLITDILGLHNLFISNDVTCCYNPSWWFYSCIIVLYAIFPFLYKWVKKNFLLVLMVSIAVSFSPFSVLRINYYIISFVVGMWMAMAKVTPPSSVKYLTFYMILFILFCIERFYNKYTSGWDCLIVISIFFIFMSCTVPERLNKILIWLGKHSMDMFLFHVFIIWWFKDLIFMSRNPFIIFLTLIVICIPVSMIVEMFKKYTVNKVLK